MKNLPYDHQMLAKETNKNKPFWHTMVTLKKERYQNLKKQKQKVGIGKKNIDKFANQNLEQKHLLQITNFHSSLLPPPPVSHQLPHAIDLLIDLPLMH